MRRAKSPTTRPTTKTTSRLPEILGWIGVFFILCAYAGNSLSLLPTRSIVYLLLNIIGSVGILIEARHKKDLPALWLNIIWALIALVGLVRFFISS